jgi:hypothetical protein
MIAGHEAKAARSELAMGEVAQRVGAAFFIEA